MRTISWFSCGAASAVATKLSNPDVIAYCDTGSEDEDNKRFMSDCEQWFGKGITILKNEKYQDTWDVWEDRRYIAGIDGAPCTSELKVAPRLAFELPDDIHIFGYTNDANDIRRAKSFGEHWPDLKIKTPLIENGLTKANCLSLLESANIKPPRVYAMGYPNANCIPCPKATSPSYWAVVRKYHPKEFARMAELSRRLGARLCRHKGVRIFIDELPDDVETKNALAPECDFLCGLYEESMK